MIIEIPEIAPKEEKLLQLSETLERIKSVMADITCEMDEEDPVAKAIFDALEDIDDAIDSVGEAVDLMEEEEAAMGDVAEGIKEADIEGMRIRLE